MTIGRLHRRYTAKFHDESQKSFSTVSETIGETPLVELHAAPESAPVYAKLDRSIPVRASVSNT